MKNSYMILICLGTRPEVIKLSPIIQKLKEKSIPYKIAFTGQHRELFDDVKNLISTPDYNLSIMKQNQTLNDILSAISSRLPEILNEVKPNLIIVQGDTTTVLSAALVGFNMGVDIGHVEAGLRTHNIKNPFPEEANRQLVSRIARFNWAPTSLSKENLIKEGISNVNITGNTVIDGCLNNNFEIKYDNKVLVTLHRRENFGKSMDKMIQEIDHLAKKNPELEFIFPMHPNPNVQKYKPQLKHINVIDPLKYNDMLKLISEVKFVISDSGGIQEECGAFGKKILVCRQTTERPEGVDAGFAKLIGDEIIKNFEWANDNPNWSGVNPYGDGTASDKIVNEIEEAYSL